jgi:hypothetical protein
VEIHIITMQSGKHFRGQLLVTEFVVRYMLEDRRACYVVTDHKSFYMNERDIEIIFELLMANGFERVGSRRRPVFRPGTKKPPGL